MLNILLFFMSKSLYPNVYAIKIYLLLHGVYTVGLQYSYELHLGEMVFPVQGIIAFFSLVNFCDFFPSGADPGSLSRIPHPNFSIVSRVKKISIFNPKNCSKLSEIWSFSPSQIRITDPGIKKAPEPGSGSETLVKSLYPNVHAIKCTSRCMVYRSAVINYTLGKWCCLYRDNTLF